MKPSEMTNEQIADYILSLQSDVDGFPFSSNETIREAAKRLLTDGDDDISKDAKIEELRDCLRIIRDNLLSYTIKSEDGKYVNNGGFLSEEFVDDERWRKALEGVNDEGK